MATSAKALLSPFQQISLHPLVGILDSRSRPADIPSGAFRWKLNVQTTVDAKACRRAGFPKFNLAGATFTNQDLHAQGQARNPLTFLYENTTSARVRQLFAGTQDSLWLLDTATGLWNFLVMGLAGTTPNTRWRADSLQNLVFFANGVRAPGYVDAAAPGPVADIPCLGTSGAAYNMTGIALDAWVAAAEIVIQFCGVVLWMNITDNLSNRYPTKIFWSNLNQGLVYSPCVDSSGNPSPYVGSPPAPPVNGSVTICGFQDLPYGDEIVGAIPLSGSLYVFTRRGIWRITAGGASTGNITASGLTASNIFSFAQIYSEPKNQTGCLNYPFTLVSNGQDLYYGSREAIYKYNPYMVAPERTDWLYRAAGAIYKKNDTAIDSAWCNLPSAEYTPNTGELWFSWPSFTLNLANRNPDPNVVLNNWTMVFQLDQKTGDVLDCGFSAFVNFRETPPSGACNEVQDFLVASTMDYCIKEFGVVFYREYLTGSTDAGYDPTVDNAVGGVSYEPHPYNSLMRGLVPTGYFDREKLIRQVHIEDDVTDENVPAMLNVRLGQSYSVQDPNEAQSNTAPEALAGDTTCSVLWQQIQSKVLACSDPLKMNEMAAKNLKPAQGKDYAFFIQNRYLYWEVSVTQPANPGSTPSAGDVCWEGVSFDMQGLPKT